MLPRLSAAIVAAGVALVSCGGGGSADAPALPPTQHRTDLLYGYFGWSYGQTAEVADHTNLIMTPDWGDWSDPIDRRRIADDAIAALAEAQARGVRQAAVSVGFLLWDNDWRYRGTAELVAFQERLSALGLLPMVVALYPVDEPETHPLPEQDLRAVLADVARVWPGPALAVIYGPTGAPAADAYGWVGRDDYDRSSVVVAPLRPGQRLILVPGGADPWAADPRPWLDYADAHPEVVAVLPFIWIDGWGGTAHRGIRSNGRRDDYIAAGRRAKGT